MIAPCLTTNNPNKKNKMQRKTPIAPMYNVNALIYYLSGVISCPWDDAKSAIYPRTVLAPMLTTTPFPLPSFIKVPKKHRLAVSRG